MAYSTCCGAHTNFTEIGICPDCMEHCDWEDGDNEPTDEQTFNNHRTEGGISYGSGSGWQGR
jgi:hypothetical protein